ncbi:MAG: DUF4325 domain-containing protein [Pyrinomonadaceae bacterium]|nr:DUF4325 domain-containing protein [Pyrinomonadaceae bacterium]
MSDEKETVILQIPESFTFGNFEAEDFDRVLSFFDWSLKDKKVDVDFRKVAEFQDVFECLFFSYLNFLLKNSCEVKTRYLLGTISLKETVRKKEDWDKLIESIPNKPTENLPSLLITDSKDRERALEFSKKFIESINNEYEKTLRYVLNELLYNALEHGKNGHPIPSFFQLFWDKEPKELSFIVADIGIGIRKHLRQTYPNLVTDVEAILHSIKPQVSGTFGKSATGYETKNNAGVGLFFSSNIAQRLNADMFIVSGNGFVHISPTEIISKELEHQWKGTFVYVKIKVGLIEDLNLQKMLSEITKSIPKPEKAKDDNNLYISIRNYFGKYAEDKDLAKKVRDKYILPALAENKTLTLDFEEIVSAPHSLLNAMLATPIERLGLAAYKKIKIINAAPDIRETLDFIFDDNTSNA